MCFNNFSDGREIEQARLVIWLQLEEVGRVCVLLNSIKTIFSAVDVLNSVRLSIIKNIFLLTSTNTINTKFLNYLNFYKSLKLDIIPEIPVEKIDFSANPYLKN